MKSAYFNYPIVKLFRNMDFQICLFIVFSEKQICGVSAYAERYLESIGGVVWAGFSRGRSQGHSLCLRRSVPHHQDGKRGGQFWTYSLSFGIWKSVESI